MQAKERKTSNGDIEGGVECPQCHLWVHSYYLSPELIQKRVQLGRFKRSAHKSEQHWNRYQRKLAEYQRAFSDFNQRVELCQ
jgi:hypothetical protein